MRRLAVIGLVSATLFGCAEQPSLQTIDASTEAVAFRIHGRGLAEAEKQASLYCANLGRVAVLGEVRRESDEISVAQFACRR